MSYTKDMFRSKLSFQMAEETDVVEEDVIELAEESHEDEPPFAGPYRKASKVRKDRFGNVIKSKNVARHLARQQMRKRMKSEEVEPIDEVLDTKEKRGKYFDKAVDSAEALAKTDRRKYQTRIKGLRRVSKKIAHSMKNEEVEQIDEISVKTAARAASSAADPDYSGNASHQNIARMAGKKFGKKIGSQIADVEKGHYPRHDVKPSKDFNLHSKINWRSMRSTGATTTTKGGKLTKTAQKGLKSSFKEEAQIDEVSPPGREDQVKALKKAGVRNPWAVAWSSYNKSKKKD